MKTKIFLALLSLLTLNQSPAYSMIVINEILADPPAGLLGDANGDGLRSSTADEFVELLNTGLLTIDLSGWTLSDASSVRHTFETGTLLETNQRNVVFGGGLPNIPGLVFTASTGSLSLNNSGDSLFLRNASNLLIHQVTYGSEASLDQSITLSSDGTEFYHLHSEISSEKLLFSPGTDINGQISSNIPTAPEASVHFALFVGLIFYIGGKTRRQRKIRRYVYQEQL